MLLELWEQLTNMFFNTTHDLREQIRRENLQNLREADPSRRPAGLPDFEREMYRRHRRILYRI